MLILIVHMNLVRDQAFRTSRFRPWARWMLLVQMAGAFLPQLVSHINMLMDVWQPDRPRPNPDPPAAARPAANHHPVRRLLRRRATAL